MAQHSIPPCGPSSARGNRLVALAYFKRLTEQHSQGDLDNSQVFLGCLAQLEIQRLPDAGNIRSRQPKLLSSSNAGVKFEKNKIVVQGMEI